MGIDYYTCAKCSDNFPDCSNHAYCEKCENFFCSNDCARLKPIDEEESEDNTNCCLCRKEHVTDYDLLYFLLKHCNLTKEDAINLYKDEK